MRASECSLAIRRPLIYRGRGPGGILRLNLIFFAVFLTADLAFFAFLAFFATTHPPRRGQANGDTTGINPLDLTPATIGATNLLSTRLFCRFS